MLLGIEIPRALKKDFKLTSTSNSAYRILTLIEKASNEPDNKSTAEVWASLLGVDEVSAKQNPHQLYTQLKLVCEEVENVRRSMANTDLPDELYSPYLKRILNTVSVNNLSAHWQSYKKNLRPEVILCIKYCAALIPEEDSIDYEALQAILFKIQELREEINSNQLSEGTYSFLAGQLDIIEKAIKQFPIKGAESIRKAFHEGFTDLADHIDDLKNDGDKVEVKNLSSLWSQLKKAGDATIGADRIANACVNLIEKGRNATETVSGLLQGPS